MATSKATRTKPPSSTRERSIPARSAPAKPANFVKALSIYITATVIEGAASTGTGTTTTTTSVGQPVHDGTQVTFTTTLGTLQPATASTKNGQVTVQLVGDGRSGVARVTAFSGAASSNTSIIVGAAAALCLS